MNNPEEKFAPTVPASQPAGAWAEKEPAAPPGQELDGLTRFVLTLLSPLWVPLWAIGQLVTFFVGISRYLTFERFLIPLFGRRLMAESSPTMHVLASAGSVLVAPIVLVGLIVKGAVQLGVLVLVELGRWQGGFVRKGKVAAAKTPFVAPLLLGLLWLLLLATTVAVLIRPLAIYVAVTHKDPFVGTTFSYTLGDDPGVEPVVPVDSANNPPWWLRSVRPMSKMADTEFLTGVAVLAAILLIRWPWTYAGRLGEPESRIVQVAVRYAGVLFAIWVSLFGSSAKTDVALLYVAGGLACFGVLAILWAVGYRIITSRGQIRAFVPFLAWRLLERKLIAFFAVGAIAFCTMMVLIVISVMGGFLDSMLAGSHGLLGDLVVDGGTDSGFAGYDEFMKVLNADQRVAAATPIIYGYGLLREPASNKVQGVQIVGIDLAGKEAVVNFTKGLHYQKKDPNATFDPRAFPDVLPGDLKDNPIGAIVGTETIFHRRGDNKFNYGVFPRFSRFFLTLQPMSRKGKLKEPFNIPCIYVDDHRTGVYSIDSKQVYIPFDYLQKSLDMDANDGSIEENIPPRRARASQIQIRLTPGPDGQPRSMEELGKIATELRGKWDELAARNPGLLSPWVDVLTWDDINKELIGAVRKEKFMVTTIFGVISLVSVVLVFVLLYLIAMDKTRDVGIIKSVGGSNASVAGIFVAYGAVIGIVGGAVGLLLGTLFTNNINAIQDFLASLHPALRVYDPKVYTFESIPSTVKWTDAAVIFVVAVLSSVMGAVVPAVKAANMQPVESLRYE